MDNKILYGVLTLLFSQIGVPQFMQGKIVSGVLRIVLSCVPLGCINFVLGIIKGIKIFQMTDEEFAAADKATLQAGWSVIEE